MINDDHAMYMKAPACGAADARAAGERRSRGGHSPLGSFNGQACLHVAAECNESSVVYSV